MCLAKVYLCQGENQTLVTENSVGLEYSDGYVLVKDLLKNNYKLQGQIRKVDLENSIIFINKKG
jgi:predicted RNA-binding protein